MDEEIFDADGNQLLEETLAELSDNKGDDENGV